MNGYSAAEIHQQLVTGHGNIMRLHRTEEIVKEFKDDVWKNLFYGSGRPRFLIFRRKCRYHKRAC